MPGLDAAHIHAGYRPGIIGRTVELHGLTYARIAGFGRGFECQVAAGLAEFATRLEAPSNGLWSATADDSVVGSVAIDGEDLAPGLAHLRWFIVAEGLRGGGIGGRLLAAALQHCDTVGFTETHLWTFKGLDAARRLYESNNFTLAEERLGQRWGKEVLEQRFVRLAQPAPSPCATRP